MHLSPGKTAAASRGKGPDLVIDGEAVVVDRVALVKSAVQRAASAPPVFASDDPETSLPPETQTAFGRRGAAQARSRRRPAEPDLFFQARSLERFAKPARAASGGVSIFMRDTAGSLAAGRKMAGLGLLVVSLLVPAAILVSRPTTKAVAVTGATGDAVAGFVIEDLDAAIRPRAGGDILEVEGRMRNVSGAASTVPPLRIALSDATGTTTLRPVSTGNRTLAAGGTLRFHSAVAVPAGTEGDVSVGFATTGRSPETMELASADGLQASPASRKSISE